MLGEWTPALNLNFVRLYAVFINLFWLWYPTITRLRWFEAQSSALRTCLFLLLGCSVLSRFCGGQCFVQLKYSSFADAYYFFFYIGIWAFVFNSDGFRNLYANPHGQSRVTKKSRPQPTSSMFVLIENRTKYLSNLFRCLIISGLRCFDAECSMKAFPWRSEKTKTKDQLTLPKDVLLSSTRQQNCPFSVMIRIRCPNSLMLKRRYPLRDSLYCYAQFFSVQCLFGVDARILEFECCCWM